MMKHTAIILVLMLGGAPLLAACSDAPAPLAFFGGIKTQVQDQGVVQFTVAVDRKQSLDVVAAYAECAAAGYAVKHGVAFTKHVHTEAIEVENRWVGTALYNISPTLTQNDETKDANEMISYCTKNRIPVM